MPKPLSDVFIRHGINLTRYSNYEAQRLIKLLDTANSQIQDIITKAKAIETKEKYRRISSEIRRITKECGEQLNRQLMLDFKELADAETGFFSSNVFKGAGVKVDFDLPSASKIWSVASFDSYADGHETFETYLNGLSENMYKTWDTQVRAGYLTGMTAKQINRAVLGSADGLDPGQMQTLRRSLEANTRTMVASMAETARNAIYKANSKLFSGYRYVGTLDSRTCLVCGGLDGQIFETLENAPKLPQHHNCRCILVPLVKGMEEKDDDDTRASADGPVSAKMSYSEWLKTQSDEVVRDILGPARFEMFKKGDEISGFVADGRTLTLEQLRRVDKVDILENNIDNLEKISDLKEQQEFVENHFNKIGDGTSRSVYELNDNKVLKIIKKEIFVNENLDEINLMKLKNSILPKLYNYDEQGNWLITEKLIPVDNNTIVFKNFNLVSLAEALHNYQTSDDFAKFVRLNDLERLVSSDYFKNFIDFLDSNELDIRDLMVVQNWGKTQNGRILISDVGLTRVRFFERFGITETTEQARLRVRNRNKAKSYLEELRQTV